MAMSKAETIRCLIAWASSDECELDADAKLIVLNKIGELARTSEPEKVLTMDQRLVYAKMTESAKYKKGI